MRDEEIRSMVEKILDQMLNTSTAPEPKRSEVIQTTAEALKKKEIPAESGECLEDITKTDLRRQLLVKKSCGCGWISGHESKDPGQTGNRQSRCQIPDRHHASRPGRPCGGTGCGVQ